MKKEEAINLLGKKIQVVISNQFRYKGKVLQVNEDSLVVLDKFSNKVSINLNEIVVLQEVT